MLGELAAINQTNVTAIGEGLDLEDLKRQLAANTIKLGFKGSFSQLALFEILTTHCSDEAEDSFLEEPVEDEKSEAKNETEDTAADTGSTANVTSASATATDGWAPDFGSAFPATGDGEANSSGGWADFGSAFANAANNVAAPEQGSDPWAANFTTNTSSASAQSGSATSAFEADFESAFGGQ